MTLAGINQVMLHLMTYFPKSYPPDMPQARVDIYKDDMFKAFKNYPDEEIIEAYKELLTEQRTAPYLADVINKVKVKPTEKIDTSYHPDYRDDEGNTWFWKDEHYVVAVPNPHSRAVMEMLRARMRMADASKDPHDLAWYKEQYPQRPEDNNCYSVGDILEKL